MLESPDYFFRVREIGRLRQTMSVHANGCPLHLRMRDVIRKSTTKFRAVSAL